MIKNYTSGTTNTFDKIQKILATHGAKRTMFEYDNDGRIKALMFSLDVDGKEVAFKLPAKVDRVEAIFYKEKNKNKSYYKKDLTTEDKAQAYRTAWANIRDWVDAQMALIDTEQVKVEEVFLPYALTQSGQTYFEQIKDNQFLLESAK